MTQTITSETETTEQLTRDLQSTERSELGSEMSSAASRAMALSTGVEVSASYGPVVSVDASADFSYETAQEEAQSTSSNFVQEIMDQSISSISERRLDRSVLRTVSEVEENNEHGFSNETADHIIGVYRYVTQRWKAQIRNYGRRLLFEFIVPEPGANWLQANNRSAADKLKLEKPPTFSISAADIEPTNYLRYAADFSASDIEAPPVEKVFVTQAVTLPENYHGEIGKDDYNVKSATASIPVPPGYVAKFVTCAGSNSQFMMDDNTRKYRLDVIVGNRKMDMSDGSGFGALDDISDVVEVAAFGVDIAAAAMVVKLKCARTEAALDNWRVDCFDKMKQANDAAWAAYNAQLATAENVESAFQSNLAPDHKRAVEREELKRGALAMLTNEDNISFDQFDAVNDPGQVSALQAMHEIDVVKAFDVGPAISFFELAFEWAQMTYVFYPYFWGEKSDWLDKLKMADSDPTFQNFLRAGSSRVQIPVRPGFERAVLFYLHTGEIWAGRDAPVIGSPLYVPIVEEIAEGKDVNFDKAKPYGDPWEYSMPTDLVILDPDDSSVS